MAREFKETAHLKTDLNAYSEGWERIFKKALEDKERVYNCETCNDTKTLKRVDLSAIRCNCRDESP